MADTAFKKNDALFLHHPQIGFIRGWAAEDHASFGSASFRVTINSEILPGVSEMVVNTNYWKAYAAEDPVILKKIADQYVKPWVTR